MKTQKRLQSWMEEQEEMKRNKRGEEETEEGEVGQRTAGREKEGDKDKQSKQYLLSVNFFRLLLLVFVLYCVRAG